MSARPTQTAAAVASAGADVRDVEDMAGLDEELARHNLEGHWKLTHAIRPEPLPFAKPYLWRWHDIRRLLWRAGEMRGIEGGASRRTVRLCTPGHATKWTTPTIHASVQLIKPGEIADAHRHTMGAIRFVLEGRGGYTAVEGDKLAMEPGDLILTPAWAWHDHGHEGDIPTIWIDIHDFPITKHLGSLFTQPFSALRQPLRNTSVEDSPFVFKGGEMMALLAAKPDDDADPGMGVTVDYRAAGGGDSTLVTMACRLHRLKAGMQGARARQTANSIFHVVSGAGQTVCGTGADQTVLDWRQGDIFVMPGWTWHDHRCGEAEAVLFSVSDEPIHKHFGLMRREVSPR